MKQMNHMIPDIKKSQVHALNLNPVYLEQRFKIYGKLKGIKQQRTTVDMSAKVLNGQDSNHKS